MEFLILKWVHILSATVLFGTGIGSAFFVFRANRLKDINAIAFALRQVVIADWIFTTPAGIVQLASGIWLVIIGGYRFSDLWITGALALFAFAGAACSQHPTRPDDKRHSMTTERRWTKRRH